MGARREPMAGLLATAMVAVTLAYLWPGVYLLGHRHWLGTAVILFNLLLCVGYNRRCSSGWHEWGFSWADFFPGLRLALLFTAPALLLIFFAGLTLRSLAGREHPAQDLTGLFLWALAQQFALQTIIFRELRKQFTTGRAILAAALIFSALHLPNPFLLVVTFCGALLWCWIYSRHPNLLPLALSHSLCSLMILASLSKDLTGSLRVGYSYLLLPP